MDINLKILILEALNNKHASVTERIKSIKSKDYSDLIFGKNPKYDWFDNIPEVIKEIEDIEITQDMLDEVTRLSAECAEIHFMVMPNWDGEGDDFNIKSLKGIEKIPNLSEMSFINFTEVVDQELLLDIELKELSEFSGMREDVRRRLEEKNTVID